MPIIYEVEQGSAEWHELRAGRITASNFKLIMEGSPKGWARFMEQLHGVGNSYVGNAKPLEWGTKHEPEAVTYYELTKEVDVRRIGFAVHSGYDFVGSSPDGLLGDDGGIEVKCPYVEANHIATLEFGMPEKHVAQVQGNIWVMEREWWDFVSYDPRQLPEKRLYVQRVYRDDVYIKRLEEKINRFWDAYLRGRTPGEIPQSFEELTGSGK